MKIYLAGNITVYREREYLLEEIIIIDYFHIFIMAKIKNFTMNLNIE
jgi:hypothetical protein